MKSVIFAGLAASASAAYLRKGEEVVPGQYIIRLASHIRGERIQAHVDKIKAVMGEKFHMTHSFPVLSKYGFSGYAAKLSPEAVEFLLKHSDVLEIEEDQIAHTSQTCNTQTSPWWGLRRTNIRGSYTSGNYQYADGADGTNVDAYVIDTGVYCENVDFASCSYGVDYVDGSNVDGNGHGTHVGSTIAGKTYGVAKKANIIAVRVLDNNGSGSYSNIIAGVEWVVQQSQVTGRRSLSNLSLGGGFSSALNDAINAAVAANVPQIIAAGNSNRNACSYSPASAQDGVTVGATDINDYRASYSNYGSCLDIFGPGSDIKAAWIGSTTATNTISGTSMATPHVAGVAAKYLSLNPSLSAYDVTAQLQAYATQGVVINESGGDTTNSANVSPDLLVFGHCTQP